MLKLKKLDGKVAFAAALAAPMLARADGPDVTAITAAAASVAVIGAAVFAVKIGIKVWHWMGRAAS